MLSVTAMDHGSRVLDVRRRASSCERDIPIRTPSRRRLPLLALLPLLACLSCASDHTDARGDAGPVCRPAPPCPTGWFQYSDSACSPPALGSGPGCSSNGDGLCYKTCNSDDDCRGVGFSTCGSLTFYQGTDEGRQRPACIAPPPSSAPPLCADAAVD